MFGVNGVVGNEDGGAVDGSLLEDPDGGHVGQCASDPLVRDAQWWPRRAEQVQSADRLIAQTHRERMQGGEPDTPRRLGEAWPPRVTGEVSHRHGLAGTDRLDAGAALLSLELEELEQSELVPVLGRDPDSVGVIVTRAPRTP